MSNKIVVSTPEEIKMLFKECISDVINQSTSINRESISIEYLSAKQACLFLNLKIQSLYNLVCKDEISFKKVGKKLYFSKKDLVDWIEIRNKR